MEAVIQGRGGQILDEERVEGGEPVPPLDIFQGVLIFCIVSNIS